MHRWVTALCVPLIWLPLIFGGVGAEPPTETVTVEVQLNERWSGWDYPATGVTVTLTGIDYCGVVLDTAITNEYGECTLEGQLSPDDSVGVWFERPEPGGHFNSTVPKRCGGYRLVSLSTRWSMNSFYNLQTDSQRGTWYIPPPPR